MTQRKDPKGRSSDYVKFIVVLEDVIDRAER
jgi:hypothetical protein